MTAISKNVYFDVLDDIVDKYDSTIHRTIKMKPIEVTDHYYAKDSSIKPNKKDPKFKVSDNVRDSKYKTFLLRNILQIGQKKSFLLLKLRIQFLGLMLLVV